MKHVPMFAFLPMLILLAVPNTDCARRTKEFSVPERISSEDVAYLRDLASDTWRCIDAMVDKNTQLPYDNMKRSDYTSVTNLGLYVASVAAAVDLGFLPRKDAVERLRILLTNLRVLVKWNGIPQTWNSVRSGTPMDYDQWISTLDSGNYYAGLRVGRAYFPELKKLFSEHINGKNWADLYNPETKKLRFGYNRKDGKFGGDLNDLGADSRLACFLAIASGEVPLESWKKLDRSVESRYEYQYLQPGWQGGGLFMQYISGLILREWDTYLGLSASNFAFAQILNQREHAYPVWGWSACESPDGQYLGIKALRDEIVTPHASALAIVHYPSLVVANLKKLEEMGARMTYPEDGQDMAYGFRDSININNGGISANYLILDQSMLFLSLANVLNDGVIWRTFMKDKQVKKAYGLIADLQPQGYLVEPPPSAGERVNVFTLRDTDPSVTSDAYAKIVEEGYYIRKFIVKTIEQAEAVRAPKKVAIDAKLNEWAKAQALSLTVDQSAEIIKSQNTGDQGAEAYFMWDPTYLYFAAKVRDNDLVFTLSRGDIWKDDVIELFISPTPDQFIWGDRGNYQIGFAASGPAGKPQTWAWFQDGVTGDNVQVAAVAGADAVDGKSGYMVEAAIKWSFLKVKPGPGVAIGVSPAVHFIDTSRENEMKLNWSFLTNGKALGRLTLK